MSADFRRRRRRRRACPRAAASPCEFRHGFVFRMSVFARPVPGLVSRRARLDFDRQARIDVSLLGFHRLCARWPSPPSIAASGHVRGMLRCAKRRSRAPTWEWWIGDGDDLRAVRIRLRASFAMLFDTPAACGFPSTRTPLSVFFRVFRSFRIRTKVFLSTHTCLRVCVHLPYTIWGSLTKGTYVRGPSSSRDRGREPKCLVAHRTGHACTPMGGVAMPGGRGCDARTCLDDLDASLFPADETMRPALWVQGLPSGSPGIFSRPLRRGCVIDGVGDCVGTSALLIACATCGRFWCVARHEWQTSRLILRTHHP